MDALGPRSGNSLNSILLAVLNHGRKVCFVQRHNPGLRQFYLTVSKDLLASLGTFEVFVSLQFWFAVLGEDQGP